MTTYRLGNVTQDVYVRPLRAEIEPLSKAPRLDNLLSLQGSSASKNNAGTKVLESLKHRAPPVPETSSTPGLSSKEVLLAVSKLVPGAGSLLPAQMLERVETFVSSKFETNAGKTFTGAQLLTDAWVRDTVETGQQIAHHLGHTAPTTPPATSVRLGMALFPLNEFTYLSLGSIGSVVIPGAAKVLKPAAKALKQERRVSPSPTSTTRSITPDQKTLLRNKEIADLPEVIKKQAGDYDKAIEAAEAASRLMNLTREKRIEAEGLYDNVFGKRGKELKNVSLTDENKRLAEALKHYKEADLAAQKEHGRLMQAATEAITRLNVSRSRLSQLLAPKP